MWFNKIALKNYKNIWSLARSSKYLYKKMVCNIDFSKDLKLVEYGPGDWVFTDELIKQTTNNSKIYLFEIDPYFCDLLKEKYKNNSKITIYDKSAAIAKDLFDENSIDCVLSSLPLAFIDDNNVNQILKTSKCILKPEWNFVQYQYFLQNKNNIKNVFWDINYKFTPLNFPPAFVYVCQKKLWAKI